MRNQAFTLALIALTCVGCSNDRPEASRSPDLATADAIRDKLVGEGSSSDGGPAEELADPTEYLTLSGTFKLDGAAPSPGPLNVDKNIDICLPGGGSMPSPSIKVNASNQGIQNVLIYADKVPDAWVHEAAKSIETEALFDQKQCLFLSQIFAVNTSQKIMIKNSDPIGHNTKFEPRGNAALNVNLGAGETYPYNPQKEVGSPFPVNCTVHGWMKAYMIFRDNAYFAVSDADGKFKIENVPAGVPLQWKIWHELAPSMKSINIGGAKQTLSRGGMKYTLDPATTELEFTISAAELK